MTGPDPKCPRCRGAGWVELVITVDRRQARAEASCPRCCAPSLAARRRWRDAHGWTVSPKQCRSCGRITHCHDIDGAPRHLHCNPYAECTGQLELAWHSN